MVATLRLPDDAFSRVFISPTDPIAVAFTQRGALILIRLLDGEIISQYSIEYEDKANVKLRFSKSGDFFLVGTSDEVLVLRAEDLELVRRFEYEAPIIDWNENTRGKLLAILTSDGKVTIWDYGLGIFLDEWEFGGDVSNCNVFFIDDDHRVAIIGEEEAVTFDLFTREISFAGIAKAPTSEETFDANEWYTVVIDNGVLKISPREELEEDPKKIFEKMPGYYRGTASIFADIDLDKKELSGKEDPQLAMQQDSLLRGGITSKEKKREEHFNTEPENPLSQDARLVKAAMSQLANARTEEERRRAKMILVRLAYAYSVDKDDLVYAYEQFAKKPRINLILAAKGIHEMKQKITMEGVKWGFITVLLQLSLVMIYLLPSFFAWVVNITLLFRLAVLGGGIVTSFIFLRYRFNPLGNLSMLQPFLIGILIGWLMVLITYGWGIILTFIGAK